LARNICIVGFSETDQHDRFKNAHYFGRFVVEIEGRYPVYGWSKASGCSLNFIACKKAKSFWMEAIVRIFKLKGTIPQNGKVLFESCLFFSPQNLRLYGLKNRHKDYSFTAVQ